jgi:hypothetical protein
MIGYKCNYCGDVISEKKYLYLKDLGNLTCMECGKGKYEAFFVDQADEDYKTNTSKSNDYENTSINNEYDTDDNRDFGGKIKSLIKKGNDLPGATPVNRVIGVITGALVGSILLGPIPLLNVIAFIPGGIAGFLFAPYFVPWMRRGFRKFMKWIKKKINDESDKK